MKSNSLYTYRARLAIRSRGRPAVYDGDTVWLEIDLGFHTVKVESIRLFGINAPELHGIQMPDGKKARDWLRGKLPYRPHQFTLLTIPARNGADKQGKYGRYLGAIWLDGEEKSVNQQMLEIGLAVPYRA